MPQARGMALTAGANCQQFTAVLPWCWHHMAPLYSEENEEIRSSDSPVSNRLSGSEGVSYPVFTQRTFRLLSYKLCLRRY